MKKIFLILLLSVLYQQMYAKYLIREGDKFVPKEWANSGLSLNDVAEHLGYTQSQFFFYFDDNKNVAGIRSVMMKIITSYVLFLDVEDNVSIVTESQVKEFLSDFNYEKRITSYNYYDILQKSVESKDFSLKFMVDALGINCSENCTDTIINDSDRKYKYVFKNGILAEFIPTDGLGRWARYYQEGNYFSDMEAWAKSYWKTNKEKIIWELNTECNAWAKIPSGLNSKYCYMFAENNGEICNAKVMAIALYGDTDINEQGFKDITHNKAKFDGAMSYYGKNCNRYSYGDFYFLFNQKGEFNKVVEK